MPGDKAPTVSSGNNSRYDRSIGAGVSFFDFFNCGRPSMDRVSSTWEKIRVSVELNGERGTTSDIVRWLRTASRAAGST